VSLLALVDVNTSFVSAFTEDQALLNAFLAAEPSSPVMLQVVEEIRGWYSGKASHMDKGTTSEWMGPVTMLRALRAVVKRECPGKQMHPEGVLQWYCGSQAFRLYEEQPLNCWGPATEECPQQRAESEFDGVRFGIFAPGVDWVDRRLVAWPRFADCGEWGCAAGGWDQSPAATALPPLSSPKPEMVPSKQFLTAGAQKDDATAAGRESDAQHAAIG